MNLCIIDRSMLDFERNAEDPVRQEVFYSNTWTLASVLYHKRASLKMLIIPFHPNFYIFSLQIPFLTELICNF